MLVLYEKEDYNRTKDEKGKGVDLCAGKEAGLVKDKIKNG